MATYQERDRVRQSTGPTIAGIIDFTDGSFRDERFVVEDDGFPNLLLNVFKAYFEAGGRTRWGRHLIKELEEHLRDDTPLRNLMLWLGAGRDAGDGRLLLQRRWFMPWKRALSLNWKVEQSEGVLNAMQAMHANLTEATGGRARALPTWTLFK